MGLRFFYSQTLHRPWANLPLPKRTKTLTEAWQDQAIALPPAPIATLGPRRVGVHIAEPGGDPVVLAIPLMPA